MPNENGAGYYRFYLDTEGWTALLGNLDKLNSRELLTVQDSLESAFRSGSVEASVFIEGMEAFAQSPEYDVANSVMKSDFAAKGRAYIAGDKQAIAPNLLSRALRAAMEDGNMSMAAKLLEMAKNGSSFEKGAAIGALGQTKDEDILGMLLDTALIDEDTLTGRQATTLVSTLLGSETFGDETWEWVKSNFTQFVNSRVPDVRKGSIPGFAGNFCTLKRRDEAKRFFEYNAKVIPGYERSLAQTLESIELCAALKDAKAEETAKALAAR